MIIDIFLLITSEKVGDCNQIVVMRYTFGRCKQKVVMGETVGGYNEKNLLGNVTYNKE